MLIAWNNLADDATLTASSEQASAPGANVQIEHVSRKWYTVAGVTAATLLFDMGSSVACAILAVLGTNLTTAATFRLRGSDSDATGVTGEKYDSGTLNASSYGVKTGYGNVYLSFTSAAARYWLLNLSDASVPLLQVGRVFLGPKWTPTLNQGFGWSVTPQDESKVTRSYGGQAFVDERPQRRIIQFTLNFISEAEMYANAFAMARASGVARDVLAVNDIAASGYLAEQAVYGLCTASEPLVHENYGAFRQKFSIEERL